MGIDGVEQTNTKKRFDYKKWIALFLVIAAISIGVAIVRWRGTSSLKEHVLRSVSSESYQNFVWIDEGKIAAPSEDYSKLDVLNVETGVTNSAPAPVGHMDDVKFWDQNFRHYDIAIKREVSRYSRDEWYYIDSHSTLPRKLKFSFRPDDGIIVAYSETKKSDIACWITERKSYFPLKLYPSSRQFIRWKYLVLTVSRYDGANVHSYDVSPLFYDKPERNPLAPGISLSPSGRYLLIMGSKQKGKSWTTKTYVFKMKDLMR